MKRAAVFVYRGGLAHWFDVEADRKFIFFPEEALTSPSFRPEEWDEVLLIDRNVVTGATLERARKALGLPRSCFKLVGSCMGEYARRLLDEVLPPAEIRGYLLGFSGPPGAAKSFLARGIAEYRGLPYYKVGRYAAALGPGKYGEALAEKEKENPFLVVQQMAADMRNENAPLIVVDSLKTVKQATFLSYVLRRPLFGFYVDSPFAAKMTALRKDPDDLYVREREEFFYNGLSELRERFTVVSAADFQSLEPVAAVLERFGFSCPHREWGWDIFGTKKIWLDVYRKLSLDDRYGTAELDGSFKYHTRYVQKYGLSGDAARLVQDVATAFRFVDDILDEHRVRWGSPTRWVQTSCVEALGDAVVLTAKARLTARRLGCETEFVRMFLDVLDAVYYEIDVEEGRATFCTEADWEEAARREACFRAFIGFLKGEDPEVYYREGLRAQMEDDLHGTVKGGRENTDFRLNRPLWQSAWKNAAAELQQCVTPAKRMVG